MEIEGQESVVETSESPESQSESTETSQSTQAPAQAAAPKPDETPFHEHPRFKELVEQKNAALKSYRDLELKFAQLEGRVSAQPKATTAAERDELLEDLKKVDPRLAARLETFGNSSKTIEQLQAKLDQFEKNHQQQSQQATAKEAVSRINQWHDTNKVPDEIKSAINAQLDVQYMQGKLNSQNLEQAYKTAYEPYRAFIEKMQREAVKAYVPAKQADSKVPSSQPKGTPASKSKSLSQPQFKDRDELKAAVAKEYVQQQRAKREASSV